MKKIINLNMNVNSNDIDSETAKKIYDNAREILREEYDVWATPVNISENDNTANINMVELLDIPYCEWKKYVDNLFDEV